MSRPSITAIIPAMNERENLPHVLPRIPGIVDEVILVDGNSTDGTVDAALELMPSIRIVQQEGIGKGAALRTGFAAATSDIIVMLDADGSTDPGEIPAFVFALMAGADFAKGSRFLHSAGTSDMPFHRRMGNEAFVRLVRMLYGGRYTDLCYGYNAFWRRVLPYLELDGDGFEIETMMNIRALRAGLRIIEVASYEDRRVMGVGNLRTIPDGWRVLRTIVAERRRQATMLEPLEPLSRSYQWLPVAIPLNGNGMAEVGLATTNGHDTHGSNGNGHGPEGLTVAVMLPGEGSTNGHATNGHTNGHGSGVGVDGLAGVVPLKIAEAVPGYDVDMGAELELVAEGWRGLADGYVARLDDIMRAVDREAIIRTATELRAARDRGATIFIAGNGGSSATAAHWVNDLGKATKRAGRPPMRVMNLTDNVPWLTALSNDEGYERAFAGQLENFARPGDVLMVITASGNSPNILSAVEHATVSDMRTIGLVGFDGGQVCSMLDVAILVRTEVGAYGLVETAHAAIADIITSCLVSDTLPATVPTA
jgi:phosphoheptose isomerase